MSSENNTENNELKKNEVQNNNTKNNNGKNNKNNDEMNPMEMFEGWKDTFITTSKILNENNINFYLTYFFIFFFLYFTITAKYINSAFEELFERNKKNGWFLFWYYGGLILLLIAYSYYYYRSIEYFNDNYVRLKLIVAGIFVIFLLCNFCQVFLKYISIYLPDIVLRILLGLFLIFNIIFFLFYVTIFLLNINKRYNIEATIAFEMLLLIYLINAGNVKYNENSVYKNLNKHDFNYAVLNCFMRSPDEGYYNSNSTDNLPYIKKLLKEKGNDYLEFKQNIPIKYKNSKTGNMEHLTIGDFYYPGSYQSYLADTPLNGTPDEKALRKALTEYKVRIVTLDIYSSIDDEFSNEAEPVVKCEKMKEGTKPLSLNKCFEIINDHAWIPTNKNDAPYPFFLTLEFHFDEKNNILYEKIRNLIITHFRRYLMSYHYDYNGHNGKDFINKARMEDSIGKIIILTNRYPVGPLNELVNCSFGGLDNKPASNTAIQKDLYTKDMVNFEGTGVSQKESKTNLTNHCKTKIKFYHTEPNPDYENPDQAKAGLYNPKFQDVAQYGVQSTLMYLYLTDPNLNLWYLYFQKKSNFDPILKDESLRNTDLSDKSIKPQQQIKGIGKPQKYAMMEDNNGNPNFMTTDKSNIGNGSENKSFKK